MAIATMDGLLAAMPAFPWPLQKVAFTPQTAGSWTSLWTKAGIPGAGANSSDGVGGAIPTDATAGAYPFTNPTAPVLSYLTRLAGFATANGALLLYDRLWHNSGLSPTTPIGSGQTVNSTTLTRPDANGADVEAWLQVYTTLGTSTTVPTITYTDQDGNASNTGSLQGFVTAAAADRTFPFSLAAGDTGVRSIQSFTLAATFTSGTFGLILRRKVSEAPVFVANNGNILDFSEVGMPRIYDDACLEFLWFTNSAASMSVFGSLTMAQG